MDEDGLGFNAYATVLANAAAGTPGPFTIGVFGEWGIGKTSLLQMIKTDLDQRDDIATVWFNAWRYEREEHPIVPLVATIIRGLEENATWRDRAEEAGKKLLHGLYAVLYGFTAEAKAGAPGGPSAAVSLSAKDVADKYDELRKGTDPMLDRSLYFEAFELLAKVADNPDLKIVVIVDDLDRCNPQRAVRLLESIKLVLAQPDFVFVLGVARTVIEGYLRHRYEQEYGIADFDGTDYLDKIVQLPFHIPRHGARMEGFCAKVVADRLPQGSPDEFKDLIPFIAASLGPNPRALVRFLNNLLIDRAIHQQLRKADKERLEIKLEYFVVTRCLEHRWRSVFVSLTETERLAEYINVAIDADGADSLEALAKKETEDPGLDKTATTIVANPELRTMLSSTHGRERLGNRAIRCRSCRSSLSSATPIPANLRRHV